MQTFALIANVQYETCKHCNGTGKQIDQRALGQEMRDKRLKAKISLRKMAELIGIKAPYLSDLERGNRKWKEDKLALFKKNL